MRRLALIILLPVTLALPGCLAKTVVDVATLPVKAVGKGVDMATTSQSEADEKRDGCTNGESERLGGHSFVPRHRDLAVRASG